ncbi:hypothetical protein [Streptomyces olivaceiscleroticus]|uniref:C2H2-type domain-containing protein n=1 Tax=Streptomyces olivaceiscleroticus TaxID=68245 RepID=A0ABN1BLM3_9ACTN
MDPTQDQLDQEWGWITHWTDLLDQDQVWRNAEGQFLRLDDMEPDYCARVRAFILRQAESVLDRLLYEMTFGPMPSGDVAVDCFNREYDVLEQQHDNPQAWLEQHELLIALKHRSEGLPAQPTTCHCGYPFEDDEELWDHSACHPGITVD